MMFFIILGQTVVCRVPYQQLPPCDHEEADTRICVHLQDALEKGARKVLVRTVDTDVIIVLAGIFFELQKVFSDLDIWVAFGMGKYFRYYHMNAICQRLGEERCIGLPFYHHSQVVIQLPSFMVMQRSHHG